MTESIIIFNLCVIVKYFFNYADQFLHDTQMF